MSHHNVTCPKGYGEITFITGAGGAYCPVSGVKLCIECEVIVWEKLTGHRQVKKVSEDKQALFEPR